MGIPTFRDIQEPQRLVVSDLTEEEIKIVEAGGNPSAISIDTPPDHPSQLCIWWENDHTYVEPAYLPGVKQEDRKETKPWKLTGYISPADVAAHYRHHHANPE